MLDVAGTRAGIRTAVRVLTDRRHPIRAVVLAAVLTLAVVLTVVVGTRSAQGLAHRHWEAAGRNRA